MLKSRVAGIPCTIEIIEYHVTPPWRGSAHTCPSDWDWYGYTDCSYEICDQRGRRAQWLAKKVTDDDHQRILGEIAEYMKD